MAAPLPADAAAAAGIPIASDPPEVVEGPADGGIPVNRCRISVARDRFFALETRAARESSRGVVKGHGHEEDGGGGGRGRGGFLWSTETKLTVQVFMTVHHTSQGMFLEINKPPKMCFTKNKNNLHLPFTSKYMYMCA